MKKINEEEIEEILNYLDNRQTLEVKKILKNLEESQEERLIKFKEAIERVIRNIGRSTHIPVSELKQAIQENE